MTTIKVAAETLGVTANALRYYERVGVLDPIQRDDNGVRHYNDDDLERARLALILRDMGMPVKAVRQAMHQTGSNPTIDDLTAFRSMLVKLSVQIDEELVRVSAEQAHIVDKIAMVDASIEQQLKQAHSGLEPSPNDLNGRC